MIKLARHWWRSVRSPRAKVRRRIIRKARRLGISHTIPPHWRWDGSIKPEIDFSFVALECREQKREDSGEGRLIPRVWLEEGRRFPIRPAGELEEVLEKLRAGRFR